MIVFITHGDGPRGAERAVRNLVTDAPSTARVAVVSLGKSFEVPNEHCVQGKWAAVKAALREIRRGHAIGQAVTLCYVNGHMAVPFAAFALIRLFGLFGGPRTRLILWEHCLPHTHYERRRGIGRRLIRALYGGLLRMSDAIIAPSPVIGHDLDRHFPRIRTDVVQLKNPIVLGATAIMSLPVDWPAVAAIRTLFVGSLTPEKQPHLALDWISANRERGAHLLLCGDGPLRQELQRRIDEQGLPATIAGHVGNLRAYYQQADLFVCTSRYETFSNVMTEAIMCGCRVLTTAWPGADALYGREPLVSIHRATTPPAFEVSFSGVRPRPDQRLTNFSATDHLRQLEEKGPA